MTFWFVSALTLRSLRLCGELTPNALTAETQRTLRTRGESQMMKLRKGAQHDLSGNGTADSRIR